MKKVAVPEEIVNLLSDVRSFLQEKCEPPVYVSDRRLVKALALLQVPARAIAFLSMHIVMSGLCRVLCQYMVPSSIQACECSA